MTIKKGIQRLQGAVADDEILTPRRETNHMKEIQRLIAGEVKSIGPLQADALIGLSKEFVRRG